MVSYSTGSKAKGIQTMFQWREKSAGNEGLRKYVVSDEVASQERCSAQREEPSDREQGAGNEQERHT